MGAMLGTLLVLLLLLLLRRAPRILENGPSDLQHLLAVGVRTPSWGEGLPKVCFRRTLRLGHLCSQCSSVCGSSLHSGHEGSASGSSRWAYALRSGVCPARRWARRTVAALLEVALQSAFQEKCSYTMAARGLLGEGSVTMRRIRAFAVANEMCRGGVSVTCKDGCRIR